jgi:O-antigen/teichoic acid export membrane protein
LSPSLKYFGFATLLSYLVQLGLLISMSVKTVGFSSIFHWKSIRIDYVKKIISFGSLSFINAIGSALTWQSPVLICGKILGEEAAAAFAPAQLVSQTVQLLMGKISSPIVPYASRNLIEDGGEKIKSWAFNISIILAIIGFSLGLPFMICGPELVNFWLGPELIWTWKIIAVMVIGTTISQIQAVNYFLALGGGDIRPTVYSQAVMAFVVSTGIYIGTAHFNWSLLGVALYFILCIILRNTFYLAYAYSNQFSYRYSSYLFNVYLIPALFAFFSVFIGYSIKMFLSPVNIFYTGCYILLVNGLYALAGWYVIIPGHVKLIVSEKVRKWKWRM